MIELSGFGCCSIGASIYGRTHWTPTSAAGRVEHEVVEFKEGARQFSADKTGEYVSALSNEANLRGLTSGWLVFGVSNSRQVVGTTHLRKAKLDEADPLSECFCFLRDGAMQKEREVMKLQFKVRQCQTDAVVESFAAALARRFEKTAPS